MIDYRKAVLEALSRKAATVLELSTELRMSARCIANACVSLERLGAVSRAGMVSSLRGTRRASRTGIPLFCLAGRENAETGHSLIVTQRNPIRPPIEYATTVTGLLMGDPAPNRSALFQRLNGGVL